jgi:GT2 family glycosyltransferase
MVSSMFNNGLGVAVVVPNWNGKGSLGKCLDSLQSQSIRTTIIVVENGSEDGSLEFLKTNYPQVTILSQQKNLGFAGGVNVGIRHAIAEGANFVALFNNDAVADKRWLEHLLKALETDPKAGIATCKLMNADRTELDSTGDMYTSWGLPFPRGRGEPVSDKYDSEPEVFAASGGASLYRVRLLEEIGLFDEDFFAYYEDVDLSFRVQLAGRTVRYVPEALAYHQIGATSNKIKGFTTYQTIKNLPWLLYKNAPNRVFWKILPRFSIAYFSFILSAVARGHIVPAISGYVRMLILLPKKSRQRWHIQRRRTVTPAYIWSNITQGLPPNARKLRRLFHRTKGNDS